MICTRCGANLPDPGTDSMGRIPKFCTKCGEPLQTFTPEPTPVEEPVRKKAPAQNASADVPPEHAGGFSQNASAGDLSAPPPPIDEIRINILFLVGISCVIVFCPAFPFTVLFPAPCFIPKRISACIFSKEDPNHPIPTIRSSLVRSYSFLLPLSQSTISTWSSPFGLQ